MNNRVVLVLNCNWHPVGFCDVFHAVVKVSSDRAKFLDHNSYHLYNISEWLTNVKSDDNISTTKGPFAVPEIVVACHYSKIPKYNPFPTKKNILKRDNYICQYTGRKLTAKEATVDHVYPKSRGGALSWENCVAASFEINNFKGNRTPDESGLYLKSNPSVPNWDLLYRLPNSYSIPKSWKDFLGKLS